MHAGARLALGAGAAALLVAAVVLGGLHPAPAHANPAKIWVINDNVSSAIATPPVSPAAFDSAITTSAGTRLPYVSQFDVFQTASDGQVSLTGAIPYAGNTYVIVQTDGSATNVTLNGRGLACTPACDGVTTSSPDATDHIIVYRVTDTGTYSPGNTVVMTANQDSVALDSRTLAIVGQARDIALWVAKTTIQAGLSSCSLADSIASPQRTAAFATYTDINGTPLAGYFTSWVSTSTPNMIVAVAIAPSFLLPDGVTVAAPNVACGVSAGSPDLQAANAVPGAIQGISGYVMRAQTITVATVLPPPAPVVTHASSGGFTTTVETTLTGIASTLYQVDLYSSPSCGAVSGNTHLGTFTASTDVAGNLKLYSMASSAITPGWVLQATVTDPGSNSSPMSGCQAVVARACTDDTLCNGYTDAQKIVLDKDPFTYCNTMRADINGDGIVNGIDLNQLAKYFTKTVPPAPARVDQNMDNIINGIDLNRLAGVFTHPVSECA